MKTAGSADVSVVIPVRNGAPELRSCIEGILSQSIAPREIIVIDSGSTDGSLDIAREYSSVGLIQIAPDSFDHGDTRNLGARACSGELVVMTVQDARPASSDWISQLVSGMSDDRVAGVCGVQVVPHDLDKNPVEWFRPQSTPQSHRFQFDHPSEFLALRPDEKRRACGWDNVGALYRRSVLLAIPFRKTPYGEDILWAREALLAGCALVYNPSARVFHYHSATPEFAFRRAVVSMYYRYLSAGQVPRNPHTLRDIFRAARCLLREPRITWKERKQWLRYNVSTHFAVRRATRMFRDAVTGDDDTFREIEEIASRIPPAPPKSHTSSGARSPEHALGGSN